LGLNSNEIVKKMGGMYFTTCNVPGALRAQLGKKCQKKSKK